MTLANPLDASGIRRGALAWFDRFGRDLPWRQTRDPYRVWVSEIMLQQTQVATVLRYFDPFIRRFPTVAALAEAREDDVLRAWEGLGYYRRARQLHAAAKHITQRLDGRFPTDSDQWQLLPGVGRYTANAILSLAHDQALPIVEANTQRLYSRLIAWPAPLAQPASQRLLWQVAQTLVDAHRPRAMNLALMDIGSVVCQPKQPRCTDCPLVDDCHAHRLGLQGQIPGRVKTTKYQPRFDYAVVIADRRGRIWLRRCRADEQWAGLWDVPRISNEDKEFRKPLAELRSALHRAFDWPIEVRDPWLTIKHGITRYRVTLQVYRGRFERSPRSGNDARWFDASQLADLPLSTTGRKIVARFLRERS
jgi:A/G-specific adenine glycosylase